MIELTDIQHDALVEVFNIGVGHAAATMSRMVTEEVTLSVPSIKFQSRWQAAEALGGGGTKRICAVTQRFTGPFSAEAILMFPEDKSLEIVRLMIGDQIPLDELTELEQEALSEIGNIILNSCIGTLANIFGHEFSSSLPVFHLGTSGELLNVEERREDHVVMLLHIDFILAKHEIHGYVAFLLDVSSIEGLKDSINRFLSKITH